MRGGPWGGCKLVKTQKSKNSKKKGGDRQQGRMKGDQHHTTVDFLKRKVVRGMGGLSKLSRPRRWGK